jgi:hypothetical protein
MFLTIIVGTSVISFVQCAIDIATPTLGGRIGLALTIGRVLALLHLRRCTYIRLEERVFVLE